MILAVFSGKLALCQYQHLFVFYHGGIRRTSQKKEENP